MADIYFKCEHCQRSLAVDEAAVGRTVKCSDCKKPITVPRPEIDWDCSCGASMMVPSNMAGETVQCVVCKASYKVPEVKQGKLPAAGTSMPVPAPPQPGKSRTLASKRQDQQVTPGVSQLQNNPNMVAQSRKCPFCGNMLPGDAVSCVKCGVDFKTGKIAKKTANASDDKLVAPESTADKKAACPSCSGDNPVSATQCQHCGKSLDSRKTGDSKTGDAEGMLELWDSITIAKWSLLFSPVFGGTLLYHNWKSLGDDARAAKALKWVYVGLGLLAISVFVKWAALLYLPYLAVWYLMECRPQQLLIKTFPGSRVTSRRVSRPDCVPFVRAAALLIILAARAGAQDIFISGGGIASSRESSPSWAIQIEYVEPWNDRLALGLTYLNEGHFEDDHRDGLAALAWLRHRVFRERLTLELGLGPYAYCDTASGASETTYANRHGLGAMASLAATWPVSDRVLLRVLGNGVWAHDMNTWSVLLGAGWRFARPPAGSRPPPLSAPLKPKTPFRNEISFGVGKTVVNSFGAEEILALRATYRRRLTRRLEWTLGLLDEGHCDVLDRFGPVTQLWLVQEFFEGRASLGAGGGVYRAISDSREDSPHTRESALVISLTGRVLLDPRWGVRLTWDRIVTDDNRDSDVGVLGVGYLF